MVAISFFLDPSSSRDLQVEAITEKERVQVLRLIDVQAARGEELVSSVTRHLSVLRQSANYINGELGASCQPSGRIRNHNEISEAYDQELKKAVKQLLQEVQQDRRITKIGTIVPLHRTRTSSNDGTRQRCD